MLFCQLIVNISCRVYEHDNNNTNRTNHQIRFYLYPLKLFPSFWGPNTSCDHSKVYTPKHDAYIYTIQAMKRHPWRVANQYDAKIAFLPISIDIYSRGGCPGLTESTILEELKSVIYNSPIFPKIKHVYIGVDFKTEELSKKILSVLKPAGIWTAMEDRGDCKTSLPYNTNYASFMSMRTPNSWYLPNPPVFGSKRIYGINFVGQFDERREYQERVALFTSSKFQNLPNPFIVAPYQEVNHMSMIKKGFPLRFCKSILDTDRCISNNSFPSRIETQKALEISNYSLVLRGDTFGGDRWFQAMSAGSVLIQLIEDEKSWEWLPFPCSIPWRDILLSIPKNTFMQDPILSIKKLISNVSEERILELQNLSLYHTRDIDWTAYNSRVLKNFLIESYNIPCKSYEEHICLSKANQWHDKALCITKSKFDYNSKVLSCC